MEFYAVSTTETLKILESTQKGLLPGQVDILRDKYGPNVLPTKKSLNPVLLFLKQFQSPLIYILLLASGISWFFDHKVDAYIILAVIFLNGIIGFIQEFQAEKSINALKSLIVPQAKVRRDGVVQLLPATGLVPGDIVLLEEGDRVPADCRLLEGKNLQINEASLTGESYPVSKKSQVLELGAVLADRKNMLWMGTYVTSGTAEAVVTAIGRETELGEIAEDISTIKEKASNFQKETAKLSKQIAIVAVILSSLIFLIGFFIRKMDLLEVFLFTIASLVSGIPEGLPAVLTVVLAIGSRRMATEKAIVRNITATETLGAINTICTDKTGTLTENVMMVEEVYFPQEKPLKAKGRGWSTKGEIDLAESGLGLEDLRIQFLGLAGELGTKARVENPNADFKVLGDPTEAAVWVLSQKITSSLIADFEQIDDLPFTSENKFRASLLQNKKGQKFVVVLGAPELILDKSSQIYDTKKTSKKTTELQSQISNQIESYNLLGARTLGVAIREVDSKTESLELSEIKNLDFLAVIKIIDPVRSGVRDAVLKAKKAGIRTIMMTGDHQLTATTIARQIGILDEDVSAKKESYNQLELEKLDDQKFSQVVSIVNVYARLTPRMKFRIVEELQRQGSLLAMTGDGVNDAPALKKADVGISMGKIGTDVAREASDIVLADDNFVTIVKAVEQGRIVFENIRRSSYYLLTTNVAESITFLSALLIGLPAPLIASQILWMNLVTDGLNGIALATEKGDSRLLNQKPRKSSEGILDKSVLPFILIIGLFMAFFGLLIFNYFQGHSENKARTAIFLFMSFSQLANVFSMRDLTDSVFKKGLFSNKSVLLSVILSAFLAVLSIYFEPISGLLRQVPLSLAEFLAVVFLSTGNFWIAEIYKFFTKKRLT